MDAKAKTVSEVLNTASRYLIPFFQREYSWRHKHWKRLWGDLQVLLEDESRAGQHFMGPLVCTPDNPAPDTIQTYQLIDGQQRLTTLSLLLCALRDAAREYGQDQLSEQINEQYLKHKYEKGLRQFRVLPRLSDRDPFRAALEQKLEADHGTYGVIKALNYFRAEIDKWAADQPEDRLPALFHAITSRLSLVVITIDGENPYEIFESLNSTGLPLEEADLIRNFIFMQVPTADQEDFNQDHWTPLEGIFGEGEHKRFKPTNFYRNYLMRNGHLCRKGAAFVDFKAENRRRDIAPVEQTGELLHFARIESMIRYPGECHDSDIASALRAIALLEISTAYPLILNLLDRWKAESISTEELQGCLQDLSSFVLRRSICGLSTRQYNRYFPEAAGKISDHPRQELRAYWLRRGWPGDSQFAEKLLEYPIYHHESKKTRLILQCLEASEGHKESVDLEGLTIEHVMPQKIEGRNGATWRNSLGEDWKETHARWVHTLGNLTLTGYNPDMGNAAFDVKRPMLAESHVVLNKAIAGQKEWGVDQIEARGSDLADKVVERWPAPEEAGIVIDTSEETVARTKKSKAGTNRKQYWAVFGEKLTSAGIDTPYTVLGGSTYIRFDIALRGIFVQARYFAQKSELQVRVGFRTKRAVAVFDRLEQRMSEIDAKLSMTPIWQRRQDKTECWIMFNRPNIRQQAESTWPVQHEWLIDRLKEMFDVMVPIVEAEAAEVPTNTQRTELAQQKIDFWYELREKLSAKNLSEGTSNIYPSGFDAKFGVKRVRLTPSMRFKHRKVYLKLNLWRPTCYDYFDHLQSNKSEIEDAIGSELQWHGEENRKDRQVTLSHKVELDVLDDSNKRAEMLDWFVVTFKLMSDVFSEYLNGGKAKKSE